ncbi:MAG: hypothetical protein ACYTF7_11705 [Planctomycetota bacterium]
MRHGRRIRHSAHRQALPQYLSALDVLFPAFMVSFAVAVIVSLLDHKGQQRLEGVAEDLAAAGGKRVFEQKNPSGEDG